MPSPIKANSRVFEKDQRVKYQAYYWDTTTTAVRIGETWAEDDQLTAFGSGLSFAMFDLLDPAFAPADRAAIEAALIDKTKTRSVLGYSGSAYRTGVAPNIYSYWGAGAPAGGSRSKQVLLKYSGFVQQSTGSVSLVFAGQGTVLVTMTRGGVTTQLTAGKIHEPEPRANTVLVNPATITDEFGYQYTAATSFLAGDRIDIYYWHNGEPWGGIAAKVVRGTLTTTSDVFLKQVREAPILGVSFMAAETAAQEAQPIRYLLDVTHTRRVGAVTELTLTVAVGNYDQENGYLYVVETNETFLRDNIDLAPIKKGRAVHFEGGFVHPDGTEELYPRFTGYIDDIYLEDGNAVIVCRSFEGKFGEVYDENVPDRLDYHAAGFILREKTVEPVYGIPAADNWPIETFILACAGKAGIDHINLGLDPRQDIATDNHGRFAFQDATTGTPFYGARLFAARALARPDKYIQLDRQPNYGNVPPLAVESLPPDDPYLFVPQVTNRLYDRLSTIADSFGYDFLFNSEGQAVFAGRNNPIYFQYATKSGLYQTLGTEGVDQLVYPTAVGGIVQVQTDTSAGFSDQISGHFSRVDLYVGVGRDAANLNGGKLNVLVERSNGVGGWLEVLNTVYSTWVDVDESFFYDNAIRDDGTNAAVLKIMALPFDHYRITVTPAGPDNAEMHCTYRINGFAIYERDVEQNQYNLGTIPQNFTTQGNVIGKVQTESNYKDLRNRVIVVGQRRATVTDSAKLDGTALSVNNPEREFNVAVAVDPFSIYDPTASNFVGGPRATVIFDDKVTDGDFAKWLARTILYQYRNPYRPPAKFEHTIVPMMELRDSIFAVEEKNFTVSHRLSINAFVENWSPEKATTNIDADIEMAFPSYQPREDIDIDTLFVDPADGKGEPAIDVAISYKNIYGRLVDNLTLSKATEIRSFVTRAKGSSKPMASKAVSSGVSLALDYPAIPETMYLAWGAGGRDHTTNLLGSPDFSQRGYSRFTRRALVNGPYRHFWSTSWNATTHIPTLTFDFQEGDGTAGVYDQTYYGFPSSGGNSWSVLYDYLTARTISATPAENPYYDPETSILGNLIDISFALLVSGRIRVSIWAYSESVGLEVPVAWLTSPTGDPEDPEAHWVYAETGRQSFSFDGVDNIGLWNTLQSFEYADEHAGAFGDKPMAVGRGFYAWNDKATNLHTLIGDDNTWGADKPNYDAAGEPYFTIGQFSQLYVRIEVANDELLRKDFSNGRTQPRIVDSRQLPTSSAMNNVAQTYIWQHVGEPTQVAIRIQDWANIDPATNTLTTAWTPGMTTTDTDWTDFSDPDAPNDNGGGLPYDATHADVRVGKPVRITFQPRPHRGPMFEDGAGQLDRTKVSAKLTRQVHHKGTTFDSFWTLYGKSWEDFHKDWIGAAAGIEKKRLANRMFQNEDHTIEFEDGGWRDGEAFLDMEWIFDPTQFAKDFGLGQKERIRYADYEQLETLPGFDPRHLGGTASQERAYLIWALMNQLFYFSAFVIDRSGRRQWCINSWVDDSGNKRGFIDKSKIVTSTWRAANDVPGDAAYKPNYILDYRHRGADRYLVRSVFARQWFEPGWATGTYPGNPISKYSISSSFESKFVQIKVTDLNPFLPSHPLVDTSEGELDRWFQEWSRTGSGPSQTIRFKGLYNAGSPEATKAVLEPFPGALNFCPLQLGTWTWNRPGVEGFFIPNPCRDFHPYARYPLAPDLATADGNFYLQSGASSEATRAYNVLEAASSNIQFTRRDYSAQEQWYGYAFSDAFAKAYFTANPTKSTLRRNWYHGARLEMTVEEFGAVGPNIKDDTDNLDRTKVDAMFDYSRMDSLDRWDQFRGMIARAPYSERENWSTDHYYSSDKRQSASAQPIKPSGVYLASTGRLSNYSLAKTHNDVETRCHWADEAYAFFDIRFWHEYVWYGPRFFPILRNGGAQYMFLGDEYTGVSGWVGYPWRSSLPFEAIDPQTLFFDAGAWTGWRPDNATSTDPLKWREVSPVTVLALGGTARNLFVIQGDADASSTTWFNTSVVRTLNMFSTRTNIFDEYQSIPRGPRLAVAPELPQQRSLYMNASLPQRLTGL
jgi:hypothetical protein